MRISESVLVASMALGMGLLADPIPAAAADVSCQRLGGEVSALIDRSAISKNLPAARAAFQAGIMDCMEGDDAAANLHYQSAKSLLTGEPVAGAPLSVAAKTKTQVDVDCQKLGGEISALIDNSGTSKNLPLARAKFQAGIMQCMEGDDASANRFYQDAKALLTE